MTPIRPACWWEVRDRSRNSGSADVQKVWDIHNSELELVAPDTVQLLEPHCGSDVAAAWNTWSTAVELRLPEGADIFGPCGLPWPGRALQVSVRRRGGRSSGWYQGMNHSDFMDMSRCQFFSERSSAPGIQFRRRMKCKMFQMELRRMGSLMLHVRL